MGRLGSADADDAVAAYAEMTPGKGGDGFQQPLGDTAAAVDIEIVVAAALHFGKFQIHAQVPPNNRVVRFCRSVGRNGLSDTPIILAGGERGKRAAK